MRAGNSVTSWPRHCATLEIPPCARGTAASLVTLILVFGNTPMRAGNRPRGQRRAASGWKYPHARGEQLRVDIISPFSGEIPPCARGTGDANGQLTTSSGNTPMRAGNSRVINARALHAGKYPHARGEQVSVPATWSGCTEIPPCARGTVQSIIPKLRVAMKYPHARGEQFPTA